MILMILADFNGVALFEPEQTISQEDAMFQCLVYIKKHPLLLITKIHCFLCSMEPPRPGVVVTPSLHFGG